MSADAAVSRVDLGNGAYLRPLAEDDVTDEYVNGLNDPVVHRFLVGPRRQRQTRESVRAFVAANRQDREAILFGLFVEDRLRGTARLHDIREGSAFLGLAIFDKSIWGQGWGTRIVKGATTFALGELGLKRVAAVIEEENIGSQRAFENAGYGRVPSADTTQDGQVKQFWEFHPRG